MAKVSIIVPCWGVEKYLDRCMESLVNQTLKDIEIILVNDKSPDRVPEMCDEWKKRDSRIKVVHKTVNEGLGMACNSGMEVATGEYIAFCDSDDWVERDMYEQMYSTAKRYNADAVYSGIQTIDDKGVIRPMNHYDRLEVKDCKEQILSFAMNMICTVPSDPEERRQAMSAKIVLYKRSLIVSNDLHFESERKLISEDLIWNLDILGHAGCVVTIPCVFYFYFNNSSSLSKKTRLDRFPYFKTIRNELIRRTSAMRYPSETKERIDRMYLAEIRHYILSILSSNIARVEKDKLLQEMLNDEITKSTLSTYPINKGSKLHYVIFLLMKYRCFVGLVLLGKLK